MCAIVGSGRRCSMKAIAVIYLIVSAMFLYASFIGSVSPLAQGFLIMGMGATGTLLAVVALMYKPA